MSSSTMTVKAERPRRSSPSREIPGLADGDPNRRHSSDTELGELDPLRDPDQFLDNFEEWDADEVDYENGDESAQPLNGKPKPNRRQRMDEKRLSRAFEVHNRSRRQFPRLKRWLLPQGTNYCMVLLYGVIGLVLVLILSAVWAHKRRGADGPATSPPWYPSPRGGTMRTWKDSYAKAEKLVRYMSLLEKVNITTGTGWMMGPCVGNTGPAAIVGFPSLCLQDGPLGLRFTDHITAGPAGITVGATWNKKLMHKRGRLIGQEARAKGVNVQLGPAVGALGRIPAGGRNWEGFGSDPVLQGIAAALTVQGIQQEGVIATIKHFVGNEQEHFRKPDEWGIDAGISSNIDDRTLHELYAWPFADAVKAGVASVMCSYNQVNNSYACQNSKLINGILKDELGFQGFVQSDWIAQRSGVASALAGLDMSMPGDGAVMTDGKSFWGPELTKSVINGTIPLQRLNDMVTRIVAAYYQLGQDDKDEFLEQPNFSSWTDDEVGLIHPGSDDETKEVVNHFVDAAGHGDFSHAALARRVAAEGIVLLKNEKHLLPLDKHGRSQDAEDSSDQKRRRIALIGEDGVVPTAGPNHCEDRSCNEGTLASGWGSGAVEFPYLVGPMDALSRNFLSTAVGITRVPTNGLDGVAKADLEMHDKCIVFVNSDAGEGYLQWQDVKGDRNDLNLQNGGDALVEAVANRCGRRVGSSGKVIVVVHAVGPTILEAFINHDNVGAVLFANLPGQESGNALADIVFGRINPSGHLPFTIGKSLADYGPGGQILYEPNGDVPQQTFEEGTLIDYRWFDAKRLTPRFEFGYGKSYSEFKLEGLSIEPILPISQDRPTPTAGERPPVEVAPPKYDDKLPDARDLVFPSGWRRLKNYIYPYLAHASDGEAGPTYPFPEVVPRPPSPAGGREGGHPALWDVIATVDVEVTNLGIRDGSAVVQLYLIFPDDVEEPTEDSWLFGNKQSEKLDVTANKHDQVQRVRREVANKILAFRQGQAARMDQRQVSESVPPAAPPPEDAANVAPPPSPLPPPPADLNPPPPAPEDTALPPPDPEELERIGWELKSNILATAASIRSMAIAGDYIPSPGQDHLMYGGMPVTVNHAFTAAAPTPTAPPLEPPQPVLGPATALSTSTPAAWSDKMGDLKGVLMGRKRERIVFAPRLLRGFEKVHLRGARTGPHGTGESKTVTIKLTRRDFSYWSARHQNWVVPDGSFGIEVGFSSRDLRVRGRVF